MHCKHSLISAVCALHHAAAEVESVNCIEILRNTITLEESGMEQSEWVEAVIRKLNTGVSLLR